MNTNEMNDGNIFFQNFTFNRKLRILQHAEQVTQLRKKEADVLALLCDNYPNPVSQDDFLMKVWGGGYVTSQSIAQVIRSLRRSLGDDKKSTISTIPKLGYKLTITPIYEDVLPTKFQYGEVVKISHERDDFSYAEQQTPINGISSSSTISIIPYIPARKKFFSPVKIIFSSAIIILASLVGVTININSTTVDNSDGINKIAEKETPVLVLRPKNVFSTIDNHLENCNYSDNVFSGLASNNIVNDCFVD
ncbi:winged helix-turn-helix domain-containing protein [Klebsiella sp. BIGb0407]|uniref:winged helix-turn-helix domain-containing protein n=1 Tax=Klebsiella sp. BIGb0407 TaxID=2940603 RepID=UPI002166D98E|nr:winged helix-turn-helix domain-containing protein [Klebsiella sp. BIGb0407]MCS3431560.1 putative transposase [Klebsiella sp. BIGb0407]